MPSKRCLSAPVLTLGLCLAFSFSTLAAQAATRAQLRGKAFAEKNCAVCHATGQRGASKNRNALPLRNLAGRYKLENLEEAFAEGITVNHRTQEMPPFELEPETISDLIAYLKSIGIRKPR